MPAPIKVINDYFPFTATGPAAQTDPSIVALANGRIFLGYSDESSAGNPDREFIVGIAGDTNVGNITFSTTSLDETNVTAAFSPADYGLRVWASKDDATGNQDIFAELTSPSTGLGFSADIKESFLVNTDQTVGNQFQPQAAAVREGRFIIAWIDGNSQQVRATMLDAGGNVDVPPFNVSVGNVTHGNGAFELGLTVLANGNTVIAYRLNSFDTVFRIVSPSGTLIGGEIDYDGAAGGTGAPAVVALADGRFAIVTSDGNGGGAISGRIFEASGTLAVAEFNVLIGGDLPQALALPDGRFLVVAVQAGDITAQMMNADGSKDGASFIVNSVTTGTQNNVDLALLADGRIGIAWQTTENGNADIKIAIFDPREEGVVVTGTTLADNYVGSAFDDIFVTGVGNDVVAGGGGNDQLRGGAGNDSLDGGDGNDLVDGGAGNDSLDGGGGADVMTGGGGNDSYFVDDAGDSVIEGVGAGLDTVFARISYTLAAGVSVETLATVDFAALTAIDLTGNAFNQDLIGNAGANRLDGGGGADRLIGLAGDDYYIVSDSAVLIVESAGNGTDYVASRVSFALDIDANVETLATFDFAATDAINLTGNGFNQDLIGNSGANRLDGGGGADRLIGLAGDDYYVIDNGDDLVIEAVGGGLDYAAAKVSFVLAAGAAVETLATFDFAATDAINLTGNGFNQELIGNSGANRLDGGAGADRLIGLAGDDTYVIDNGGDSVVEQAGGGNDTVFARTSFVLAAGAEVETLATFDFAALTAIDLTGNAFNQDLIGNSGANRLDGGGGADRLIGLAGDDYYVIDNAGDTVIESTGGGNDAAYARVSFTLAAGAEVETLATFDFGGTEAIDLTGNAAAQDVIGNSGANRLDGGAGADRLVGLAGNDQFAFTSALGGGNVDQILDMTVGADKILLDDAVFAGLALGALGAGAFRTGATALDADDRILYDAASGALFFDADGAGGAAAVQFASLSAGLAMTANEFIVI